MLIPPAIFVHIFMHTSTVDFFQLFVEPSLSLPELQMFGAIDVKCFFTFFIHFIHIHVTFFTFFNIFYFSYVF